MRKRLKSYSFLSAGDERRIDDAALESLWLRSRRLALFRALVKEYVKRSVRVATANGWPLEARTVRDAVEHLVLEIRSAVPGDCDAAWVFVACSETLDPKEVLKEVRSQFPGTRNIHCSTSCRGVTTDAGFLATQCDDGCHRALSLFCVFDPLGAYCTVGARPCSSPASVPLFEQQLDWAYLRLRKGALGILKSGDEDPLTPSPEPLAEHLVIWMSGLPNTEEQALEALYDWGHKRFGRSVPVIGGSAADATIGGLWRTFCLQADGAERVFDEALGSGIVLTLIASSVKVFPCFMHPFTPLPEVTAKVVSCGSTEEAKDEASGRVIQQVRDSSGKVWPAGTLYREWCEEHIQKRSMPEPKTADGPKAFDPAVLAASSICPIGVQVGRGGEFAYDYRMMHPSGIYFFSEGFSAQQDDAYLKCFSSVDAGRSEIVLFTASRGDLLSRLAKLKDQLAQQIDRSSSGAGQELASHSVDALRAQVAGVLMTYCAGCMMAISSGRDGPEQLRRLSSSLANCFGGRPFMAYHPFGEQGFVPSRGVNCHSNLMFSAIAFSQEPAFEIDEAQSLKEALMPILRTFSLGDPEEELARAIESLLSLGQDADFESLAPLVRSGHISPRLFEELAICSARPLHFAVRSARMFHRMASWYPMIAKDSRASKGWFEKFCEDFLAAASMSLLHQGRVFDDSSVEFMVREAADIGSNCVVASNAFQELMEQIWSTDPDPETAMRSLLGGDRGASERGSTRSSPMVRHYIGLASCLCLTCLQIYVSSCARESAWLWSVILLWSSSCAIQTLASPSVGYFTRGDVFVSLLIVFAHACIFYEVRLGEELPRDLDSISSLCLFGNLLKGVVVEPHIGPLVMLVLGIVSDIQQYIYLLFFFAICFFCSLRALFHDTAGEYIGEAWHGPQTLLVNAVWGPQLLWASIERSSAKTLFVGRLARITDETAINIVSCLIVLLAVFAIPILLLNLLIARMAASYSDTMANVDSEFKRVFASCVLVARELPCMPAPLSLPWDMVRLGRKVTVGSSHRARSSGTAEVARGQLAISQLVGLWDAKASLQHLKRVVTVDQVQRLHVQSEGLQEKVNLLYNALANSSD